MASMALPTATLAASKVASSMPSLPPSQMGTSGVTTPMTATFTPARSTMVQPAPVASSPFSSVTLAASTGNSAWERMVCMVGMPQLNSWLPTVMAS